MQNQNYSVQMGTVPVPKLLIKLSAPLMAAVLINNLYNIVDSIFVAQLNEKALTALSLAAPVQILMAALGSGMAVGLNAVISRSLGQKDRESVKLAAGAAVFLAFCSYLLILLAQFFILEPFFAWQTKDAQIVEYGVSYLRVCMIFSFGCMLQWVFDRFLIATGKTHCFMISLISASAVNLILDPIFIFGWLGFPAMGTAGAGYATITGQIVGAVVSILLNVFKNPEIPVREMGRLRRKAVFEILRIGIPTAFMQGITSLVGMLVNLFLIGFSSTAVAVYGICLKVQNIFLIVPSGINLAMIPIIAYNYGAKQVKRERQAFRWGLIDSVGFMLFAVLLLQIFPEKILLLFRASETMLEIGGTALRILSVSMLLSVYGLILGAVLQALGRGMASLFLTFARQAVFLLPLMWFFRLSGKLEWVWMSFVFAELLGIAFAFCLHRKYAGFKEFEDDTADVKGAELKKNGMRTIGREIR